MPPGHRFPTFTTARPSPTPGMRPAGLHSCDEEALARWREDSHRYPPYQYKAEYCVHHASGGVRVASVTEREVILGFPANYTEQCLPKSQRQGEGWSDLRKTLLGNSWSVPVVVCLLKSLFERLGACPKTSIQALVDRGAPGKGVRLQTTLLRPPTRREVTVVAPDAGLARKLTGLVSVKGQDLMVQSASEPLNRHQRIRYTIPSRLWKWKEVTGWQWRGSKEHINVLEMRATLTTVRWWIVKQRRVNCRAIHLVDSMVVLHSLSRGRSSSRKLRRTVMRIGALLLLSNIHPLWTYVHTSQNPADRPSRRLASQEMGKGQKVLEGRSQQERRKIRKEKGSLKNLTLQPRTRIRYDKAKKRFYSFLSANSLELPTQCYQLDGLLCDYLEHLWSSGEGRALASDTLAALQDTSPRLRGRLPGAWRLLKTLHTNEIPNRAPPFPEKVVQSLVGYFWFHRSFALGLSTLLGFYAMLRTGELLGIRNKDVTIDGSEHTAVISLGYTKGGKKDRCR